MGYIQFSDLYKELHKIYYNGEFYTIEEIIFDTQLSDKIKVELVKNTLKK